MKKRIIGALAILLICFPILFEGGILYQIGVIIISMVALHEFLSLKDESKKVPFFIQFLSYTSLLLLELNNFSMTSYNLTVDYRVLAGILLMFLIPTILYPDKKIYSVKDAFYLIGSVFFLGSGFSLLMNIRSTSLELTIYLLLIATMTDVYAYLTGSLIGRHKMLERISPAKTLEGMFGGVFFGVLISVVYYQIMINPYIAPGKLILMTLFLSIIGQIGDLCFSAIKRYFNTKDFSNLIPGHGGILDRLDSIIFILLAFTFFLV